MALPLKFRIVFLNAGTISNGGVPVGVGIPISVLHPADGTNPSSKSALRLSYSGNRFDLQMPRVTI